MPVVMGVDSSTQSCKVELRDAEDGELLGTGSAPHPPAFAPCSEQEPASWWVALEAAIAAAVTAAGVARNEIAAIAVGAQCHGLVLLDSRGEVIRPAKLWNDTTSTPQLLRLRERIGAGEWIAAVGSLPTAAFTLSKLAWFAENEPAGYARLSRICLPHDWLTLRLSGRHVTDRSEASGTGYWSAREGRYLTEYLDLVDSSRDWDAVLPEVLGPDQPAGEISPAVARALGLSPDVVIGAGGGDQHLAALGLAIEPGDVVYSLGTSGVVYTTSLEPVLDLAGIVDGVADCAGGYLPLVSTLNAARVTDWAAGILGVDHNELGRLALAADPLRSPALAAFLDGERKPDRPAASGVLAGIVSTTTRGEIARAAFDGVLFGLVRGQARLNAAGVSTPGRVLITGGGARSEAYCQILADLTGRETLIADPIDAREATARGAAVQATAALTSAAVTEIRHAWAPSTSVAATPRPGSEAVRDQLLERYATVADWADFDAWGPR
jgi:xylulokinase